VVPPTKFVPMKTPLASEILLDWNLESPPRHPLTISLLQEDQECKGRRIGMIIDLSNHETLYGADLKEANILYERVPVSPPHPACAEGCAILTVLALCLRTMSCDH